MFALNVLPDRSSDFEGTGQTQFILCPHHASVRAAQALDDPGIFAVIRGSYKSLEAVRAAVKKELGLHSKHPGVPYIVNVDGSIIVLTQERTVPVNGGPSKRLSLEWRFADGTEGPLPTITPGMRAAARAVVESAITAAAIDRPLGSATITVE